VLSDDCSDRREMIEQLPNVLGFHVGEVEMVHCRRAVPRVVVCAKCDREAGPWDGVHHPHRNRG